MKKKILFSTIFFFLLISLNAQQNYDFILTLKYFPSPLFIIDSQITITRKLNKFTITAKNFQGRNFQKYIDPEDYIKMLHTLNRMGVWQLKTTIPKRKRNSYYEISIKNKTNKNFYRVELHTPKGIKDAEALRTVRIIEGYAKLYNPYNN